MNKNQEMYNIICFSNQLWDWPLWTNKHQIMTRLAKMGHRVIFVDPPVNPGILLLKQLFRGKFSLARLLTQTKLDKNTGTIVYTPVNFFGPLKLSSKIHLFIMNFLLRKYRIDNRKTVLWIYHVEINHLKEYLNNIPHDALVYDCVDFYAAFPETQSLFRTIVSKQQLKEQEQYLARRADIVFASAPQLVDHLKPYNSNTHFTPNAGDYELFKESKSITNLPPELSKIKRPRIGYTGALDPYKFDMKLFKTIVTENPSMSFVLLGNSGLKDSDPDLKFLQEAQNVHYLGFRPYKELPSYFAGFDAFIIPFALNDYTVGGCFPTKFHDALAAGIPVVVTDMPVYKLFEDVCYIAKSAPEFSEKLRLALREDTPSLAQKRQNVAKDNSWDGKADRMLGYIKDFFAS